MNTTVQYAVEISDVVKTFRRHGKPFHAVNHTSWRVETGEVVAFLGENGAGKSTTLDMVLGLTNPTSGQVKVLGQGPHQAVRAGKVGAVLQQDSLPAGATVREVVHMIAAAHGPKTADDERLARLMHEWDLVDIAGTKISRCSGGQIQRLRTALAVLNEPALLILDEPTAGMDVGARRQFWDGMHMQADAGRTIIFATHYLTEAEEFADRIVVISGGRIVADGTTAEIQAMNGSGRVKADFPDPASASKAAAAITARHLGRAGVVGRTLTIGTDRTDDAARYLLTETPARNLSVSVTSLEDVFTHLTRLEV